MILIQYVIPKLLITQLAGKLANLKGGQFTILVIKWFVKHYQVNMGEAANPDISSYTSFNDFFTRPLKIGARPTANAAFICPVDGAISQFGNIEFDHIYQAKNHNYSTLSLVAGNQALANKFENGLFACLYLSPKDYHRIHMPCDGKLIGMTYVPGDLFSVNPTTAASVPNLFARNERVVCEFESEDHGTFVMVLVGATIVGSIATVWHEQVDGVRDGIINPPRNRKVRIWQYAGKNITLRQCEEMGRFLLGSTVVVLFEKGRFQFNNNWKPSQTIKLGEIMGNYPSK